MMKGDLFSLETNFRNLDCQIRIVAFPSTSPISQLDRPYPHVHVAARLCRTWCQTLQTVLSRG